MLRQKSANYIVYFKRISYMLKNFGNFNKINTGITLNGNNTHQRFFFGRRPQGSMSISARFKFKFMPQVFMATADKIYNLVSRKAALEVVCRDSLRRFVPGVPVGGRQLVRDFCAAPVISKVGFRSLFGASAASVAPAGSQGVWGLRVGGVSVGEGGGDCGGGGGCEDGGGGCEDGVGCEDGGGGCEDGDGCEAGSGGCEDGASGCKDGGSYEDGGGGCEDDGDIVHNYQGNGHAYQSGAEHSQFMRSGAS